MWAARSPSRNVTPMATARTRTPRTGRGPIATRFARLTRLPRAEWGKATAHAGMGILIFGICGVMAWEVEDIRIAKIGESFPVGQFEVTLEGIHKAQGPNYEATIADMKVTQDGQTVALLHPDKRFYPVAQMPTTQAAIQRSVMRDIYLVVGDQQDNGGYAVRSYIKPFADWRWAGALIMAFGGFLSLTDRRYRIAAGARKSAASPVAAE